MAGVPFGLRPLGVSWNDDFSPSIEHLTPTPVASISVSREKLPIDIRPRRALGRMGQSVLDAGEMLVAPFERLGRRLSRKVIRASDGGDLVHGVTSGIGRALTWPFRMIGSVLRRIVPWSVVDSLDELWTRFHYHRTQAVNWIVAAVERLNLDGPLKRIAWTTQPIWHPIAAVLGFLNAWLVTRKWKQLAWGAPALVLLAPFAVVFAKAAISGPQGMAGPYRAALKEALEEQDFAKAQLYERKLAQLGVDTQQSEFRYAVALSAEGDWEGAYERMRTLAPEEAPRYARAHGWIIQRLLDGSLDFDDAEKNRLLKIHLDHLTSLGADGPELTMLRAELLAGEGLKREAVALLEPLASVRLDAAVRTMGWLVEAGDLEAAREAARQVNTHLDSRRRSGDPLAAHELQAGLYASQLLGNGLRLAEYARLWHQINLDDPQARLVARQVVQTEIAELLGQRRPPVERVAELLVEYGTLCETTQDSMPLAASLWQAQPLRASVSAASQRVIQSPEATAGLLVALGSGAATVGAWDDAIGLLREGVDRDPKTGTGWNNLAWCIMQQGPQRLDMALGLVERAMQLSPGSYNYRETRGQILARMGRWQESLDDLLYALNGAPESPVIHATLAKVYAALKQPEQAAAHQRQAN
ncbi:MAG: hypothetical protein KDA61_22340 [Planctomycetales bacterium]|nr:hypothetical protein [Planctomycetales bacterium]